MMVTTRRMRLPVLSLEMGRELVEKLDAYRYEARFVSRVAAIRYLLDYALKANPRPTSEEWRRYNDTERVRAS